MKKALVGLAILALAGAVYAANQVFTETLPPAVPQGAVAVSNGYSWSLTSNTTNPPPLIIPSYTLAVTTTSLISSTTGQLIYVSNGISPLCISSGTTAANQWVQATSTGALNGSLIACH